MKMAADWDAIEQTRIAWDSAIDATTSRNLSTGHGMSEAEAATIRFLWLRFQELLHADSITQSEPQQTRG